MSETFPTYISEITEIPEANRKIILEYAHKFHPENLELVEAQIETLKNSPNRIIEVRDDLVGLAAGVRESMEVFVVSSFIAFAKASKTFPYRYSVLPSELLEATKSGVDDYFAKSFNPRFGLTPEHWRNKWLCVMSRATYQVISTKDWANDSLKMTAAGNLVYEEHLDLDRKGRFIDRRTLNSNAMEKHFPFYNKTQLPESDAPRGLLTHATQKESLPDIWSTGFIAPKQHITPVSFSEGVISLPYSDKVLIFNPTVLRKAGFALMRYNENPIDSVEIVEVLEPLPIPVFLASGLFDTAYFKPEKVQKDAHVWSFAEPSAAFGTEDLKRLAQEINH